MSGPPPPSSRSPPMPPSSMSASPPPNSSSLPSPPSSTSSPSPPNRSSAPVPPTRSSSPSPPASSSAAVPPMIVSVPPSPGGTSRAGNVASPLRTSAPPPPSAAKSSTPLAVTSTSASSGWALLRTIPSLRNRKSSGPPVPTIVSRSGNPPPRSTANSISSVPSPSGVVSPGSNIPPDRSMVNSVVPIEASVARIVSTVSTVGFPHGITEVASRTTMSRPSLTTVASSSAAPSVTWIVAPLNEHATTARAGAGMPVVPSACCDVQEAFGVLHALPRAGGPVVLDRSPGHRGRHLALPVRPHRRHRAPRLGTRRVQPGGVRLSPPDRSGHGARPGRRGDLSRAERPPHHGHRFLAEHRGPPGPAVLGDDARVRGLDGSHHLDHGVANHRGAVRLMAVGHVLIMHVFDAGVARVDFDFVVDRWSSPFWRTWDWMLLSLALLHGINGTRVIVQDYVRRPGWRLAWNWTFAVVGFSLFVLGSVIVFTFNPAQFR